MLLMLFWKSFRMSQNNADQGDFALSVKQNDVLYHIEIKVDIVLAELFYSKLLFFIIHI